MEGFSRTLVWATRLDGGCLPAAASKSEQSGPYGLGFVAIRTVMALACAGVAKLLIWFTRDPFVGAVFGVGAAWLLRFWICGPLESGGAARALRKMAVSKPLGNEACVMATALAPLAYFLLCFRGNWFWLVPAIVLSSSVSVTCNKSTFLRCAHGAHWILSCIVSVVGCGFVTRLGWGGQALFMLSLFSAAVAWLMPIAVEKYWPESRLGTGPQACGAIMAVAEAVILLIGVLGMAL